MPILTHIQLIIIGIMNNFNLTTLFYCFSYNGVTKFKLFSVHGTNCMSLVTGFRLFQDSETLTLDYLTNNDRASQRKWRSSSLFHYGCHVMVVVYDCENPKPQEVSIYLNEVPLEMILGNDNCTQCPIEGVKKLINELLNY